MNNQGTKSGVKSSEFYITIVTQAVGLGVMLGYVPAEQADTFVQAIVSVIGGLMVIIPLVVYIAGRVKVKQTMPVSSTPLPPMPTTDLIQGLSEDTAVYPK